MENVEILTLNCRGLGERKKRKDVFNYLRNMKCNIYCLQDTHWVKNQEHYVRSEWGFQCYMSYGTSASRGTAILFNNNFEYQVKKVRTDPKGNWVALHFEVLEYDVTLINLYGPNSDSPEFYYNLLSIIDEFDTPHNICCGDWNIIQDIEIDCYHYSRVNNPKARDVVLDLNKQKDMCDPWRILNPESVKCTWHVKDFSKGSRLDYFLISSELLSLVQGSDIKNKYRSDHSSVVLKLSFVKIPKGKSFWKFNNSLLREQEYVDIIKTTIQNVIKQYSINWGEMF